MNEELKPGGPSQNWRVKVYLLNSDGNWDDCGSGTLSTIIDTSSGIDIIYLHVVSNEDAANNIGAGISLEMLKKLQGGIEDPKCVLHHPITLGSDYDKQGDSIITWADVHLNEELALSFLDTSVTREIWQTICKLQRRPAHDDLRNPFRDLDKILMPSIDNLEQIKNDLDTRKHWMVMAITENPQFLSRLYEVLKESEAIESLQNLHLIHEIIRQLVFSDISLLELLLSDAHYLLVFGALEYDLDIPKAARPKYREFLENQTHYRKVIDFKDPEIDEKIRLNFRISYLKDSVINSIIDDPISNLFSPVSYAISHDIFEHIMENDHYLDEILGKMTKNLRDNIGFLYELTQIVKTQIVEIEEKENYCQKLIKKNIYNVISSTITALYSPEMTKDIEEEKLSTLKINIVDILFYIIQIELGSFLDFLLFSQDSDQLIQGIINNLFYGDQGLQVQTGELLKFLMDTIHQRKSDTLDIFYDRFLPGFVEHYKTPENNEKFYSFVQQFVEILIHCLRSHPTRIRQYIITHKLLQKLYPGFKLREKSIHLAILRFVKNILLSKDEQLRQYILNHDLLDDIFDLYLKNAFKSNLMNSACLEFFDIFLKENLCQLIVDFVDRFREKIIENGLERFFIKIFRRYELIKNDSFDGSEAIVGFPNDGGIINGIVVGAHNNSLVFGNYTTMEKVGLEDEEYFENEDDEFSEDKRGNRILEEKPNDENSPYNSDIFSSACLLSDEQLKTNKESVVRMKNKIVSKKIETEEGDKFTFGNHKGRKMSSSSDRQFNSINIQLNLTLSADGEGMNAKREGIDLWSDEELNDAGQLDPQKKLKIQ